MLYDLFIVFVFGEIPPYRRWLIFKHDWPNHKERENAVQGSNMANEECECGTRSLAEVKQNFGRFPQKTYKYVLPAHEQSYQTWSQAHLRLRDIK